MYNFAHCVTCWTIHHHHHHSHYSVKKWNPMTSARWQIVVRVNVRNERMCNSIQHNWHKHTHTLALYHSSSYNRTHKQMQSHENTDKHFLYRNFLDTQPTIDDDEYYYYDTLWHICGLLSAPVCCYTHEHFRWCREFQKKKYLNYTHRHIHSAYYCNCVCLAFFCLQADTDNEQW